FHASFLQGNFLGLHFSPILVAPALIELAWPGPQTLDVLSAVATGLVAPASFLAARALLPATRAGLWVAVLLAVTLPFTPPLQESAWAGFHPEQLALPALLLATWALLRGHRGLGLALVAISLLTKEDQAYQVLVLGIVLMAHSRHRRLGALISVGAILFAGIVVLVAMPWFRGAMVTDTGNYYAWISRGGPGEVLAAPRIGEVVSALVQPQAWGAVGLTIAAFCLLPLLRPGMAALALPPLLAALLSRHQPQPHLQLQYGLPIVYPLVVAAALGAQRVLAWWPPRPVFRALALGPGFLVALSGSAVLPLVGLLTHASPGPTPRPGLALAAVPADAELSTDDGLAIAAASRAHLHLLPHLKPAAFVLTDSQARTPGYGDRTARERVVASLTSNRRMLWSDGRVRLWSPVE
ncbi:MAG: DUF2079 domain-containing protein, partial [Candidatus Dormibacteraeota bacterium]|nr:DUF2079 domain-containing protein [Candidatus Dormibacteraeota bacterium]